MTITLFHLFDNVPELEEELTVQYEAVYALLEEELIHQVLEYQLR